MNIFKSQTDFYKNAAKKLDAFTMDIILHMNPKLKKRIEKQNEIMSKISSVMITINNKSVTLSGKELHKCLIEKAIANIN